MPVEFKPQIRPLGGLTIYLREPGTEYFMSLNVPREALSLLAIQCINEISTDASAELIAQCREIVRATDPVKPEDYVPPWRSDVFTDDEKETMAIIQMEEVQGSAKEYAHEELDKAELIDCIGMVDPDFEETCRILKHIAGDNTYAEACRNHDEDNEFGKVLDFLKRFELITPDEGDITQRGTQYLDQYG